SQVRSSITDYIEHLSNLADKDSVDMRWPVQVMVANVINQMLFGFRYKHGDCAPLIKYVEGVNDLLDHFSDSIWFYIGASVPFLTKLPLIGWFTFGRFKHTMTELNKYIVIQVARTLENYSVEDEPTCFVQAYKQRMTGNYYLDDANLHGSCSDFFIAGQESTTTTLRWAMLIMAAHPDVQAKLRQEIHAVVGRDRLPCMADQLKMPFARACALELQRFANILPRNVPRVAVRDVEIRGQLIPEGTWVNADIHYLMANDLIFEHPNEFRPERYIS
ncbi:hypothetical protein PENTCL1PPCAC_341, partial [Pristionchus entomophagus]